MASATMRDQPGSSALASSSQPESSIGHAAAPRIDVPIPSYRIIDPASDRIKLARSSKGPSNTAAWRGFGYNNAAGGWKRGEHYVRYVEPIEAELATMVEYDMDEQDKEWVDALNQERRKHQYERVSYELFEVIMDKLEKEWFELQKRIPATGDMPAEDSRCSICDDGEGENANAIVFCDGCNLAVHQDCYGVPYIPEGQWLCRKCTVEPENPVDCVLCPSEAGAFKQTTSGTWAHLLCAIWIPEVGVANPVYMEPIEGVESVTKQRWKLVCSICKIKGGACIQCDNRSCFVAFHVTCARQQGFLASMKTLGTHGHLKAWCPKHMPASQAEQIQDRQDHRALDSFTTNSSTPTKKRKYVEMAGTVSARPEPGAQVKSARAHAKSYHFGPPLVPAIIVGHLVEYTQRVKLRMMNDIIERVCRYWSLKREARRGAPLLKRLYLEPWTASNASKEQSDADRAKRLEYLIMVRNDLERVRMLAELARKREREKLRQATVLREFVEEFFFPGGNKLRTAFDKIASLDKDDLFRDPVSREQVPDYYDVIKHPLCLSQVDERITQHSYLLREDFERDISLILDNAMLYNPPDNPYHQRAARIKKAALQIIADLPESFEASTAELEALVEVGPDGKDRLESLFSYELDPPRPPTPPPAPKRPRIQISAEESRARKEAKEARFAKIRPIGSSRSTRAAHAETMKAEQAAEIARQEELAARQPLAARRDRRRSTRPQEETPQPSSAQRDAELMPLRRPQKGVAGVVPYTPVNARSRRRAEERPDTQPDAVKPASDAHSVGVASALQSDSKRGGRSAVRPALVQPQTSTRRRQPRPAPAVSQTPEETASLTSTSQAALKPAVQQESSAVEAESTTPATDVAASSTAQAIVRAQSPALSELSSLSSLSEPEPEEKQVDLTGTDSQPDESRASSNEAPIPNGASADSGLGLSAGNGQMVPTQPSTNSGIDGGLESGPSELAPANGQLSKTSGRTRRVAARANGQSQVGMITETENSEATSSRSSRRPRKASARPAVKESQPSLNENAGQDSPAEASPISDPPVAAKDGEALQDADAVGQIEAVDVPTKRRRANEPSEASQIEAQPTVKLPGSSSRRRGKQPAIDGASQRKNEDDLKRDARLKSLRGTNGTKKPNGWLDPFPATTLVWAKIDGFPYFPAEVVSALDDYDEIPEGTWRAQPDKGPQERVWLVRFFDKGQSWGWCPLGRLEALGDDEAVDAKYMSMKLVRKTSALKAIQEAYNEAKANMEI